VVQFAARVLLLRGSDGIDSFLRFTTASAKPLPPCLQTSRAIRADFLPSRNKHRVDAMQLAPTLFVKGLLLPSRDGATHRRAGVKWQVFQFTLTKRALYSVF
jgi:hypothetical protein